LSSSLLQYGRKEESSSKIFDSFKVANILMFPFKIVICLLFCCRVGLIESTKIRLHFKQSLVGIPSGELVYLATWWFLLVVVARFTWKQ
jgi:hypothetical protein